MHVRNSLDNGTSVLQLVALGQVSLKGDYRIAGNRPGKQLRKARAQIYMYSSSLEPFVKQFRQGGWGTPGGGRWVARGDAFDYCRRSPGVDNNRIIVWLRGRST